MLKSLPPQTRLHELLTYDSSTGIFCWNKGSCRKAGTKDDKGYIRIKIDGTYYLAHRIAWKYYFGCDPTTLDHINRNRSDNSIDNLREVTTSENMQNKTTLGVSWSEFHDKWKACIYLSGKKHHIGYYDCPLLAGIDYLSMKSVLHPRFTHST
jgi:hypothetical protein